MYWYAYAVSRKETETSCSVQFSSFIQDSSRACGRSVVGLVSLACDLPASAYTLLRRLASLSFWLSCVRIPSFLSKMRRTSFDG